MRAEESRADLGRANIQRKMLIRRRELLYRSESL
jgi:hypothetical protein